MGMFRVVILVLLSLFLSLPEFALGEEPSENKLRPLADQQRKAAQDLKNLEAKMLRIAEKLKEVHPYYAEKLFQALEMVKRNLLADDVREVIAFLEHGLLGKAVTKAEEIKEEFAKLLAFLEDKLGVKGVDEKIKQLEKLIEQVDQLQKDEQKLYDETDKFNRARNKEVNEFIQLIDKLLKEQQNLREDLGRYNPRAIQAEIDKALKKITKLIKAQKNLARQTGEAEQGDLRKLGELINQLDSLINQQSDAIKTNKQLQENEQRLQKALKQLDRLINNQKLLNAATDKAIQNPGAANPAEMAKKQDEIARGAKNVEDLLKQLPLDEKKISKSAESLARSVQNAQRAGLNLDDEFYDLAKSDQVKALTDMEKARSELQKLADKTAKNKPTELAKLARGEEQMEKQTNTLAEAMRSLAREHSQTARGETINKAAGQTKSAGQNMKRAREQFNQHNPEAAEPQQAKSLSDLKNARANLEPLRQQLARPKQDTFNKLGEKQAKLSRDTKDLTEALKNLSEQMSPSSGKPSPNQKQMHQAMNKASGQTVQAAKSMDKAKQNLTKSDPAKAQPNQQKAVDALKEAERNLNDLKGKLARQDNSRALKNLALRQKESEQQAHDLANQMNQTVKKPGLNQPTKEGMRQASQNMNNAANQMSQAAQKVQQSAQSSQQSNQLAAQQQQQQAQANQKRSAGELAKAKKILEELLKPQLTKEEKRKLERLARRQKEIEEATKKVSAEAQKQDERRANQSLSRAANKMNSASRNLSSGQSQQAQADEQEALDELERTYEQLAQKKQALSDQRAQELLGELDRMLTQILHKQEGLNKETIRLEEVKLKEGELSRAERIILNKLAKNQGDLATETTEVNQKLLEEHSAVFSWVLKNIVEDMNLVKDLLDVEQRTDECTQGVQEDIIRKLKELLEALKKEKVRRKKGGGGGGSGRRKPRLLPNIAELKMLRTIQASLKRKTEHFNQTNVKMGIKEFGPIQQMMLQRLSSQQLHLSDLTKKFAEKLAEEIKEYQQMQPPKGGE